MGDLHPGNSPGASAIHGNVYLAASTISDMQLTGTAAGSQYDQLNVTGTIALDGALSITLPNPGYRPTQGTQFQIMTFGSYTGAFTSMSGLDLGNRLQLVPAYTNNALTLTAVQGGSAHGTPTPTASSRRRATGPTAYPARRAMEQHSVRSFPRRERSQLTCRRRSAR